MAKDPPCFGVQVGAVVAFMPGVTYTKEQYRQIPGYPRIDMENGTLAARFDGSIVDSKPWGEGLVGCGSPSPPKLACGGLCPGFTSAILIDSAGVVFGVLAAVQIRLA